jgi:hypothetical protein
MCLIEVLIPLESFDRLQNLFCQQKNHNSIGLPKENRDSIQLRLINAVKMVKII